MPRQSSCKAAKLREVRIDDRMFTLVYHNGEFNRRDTLLPFLQDSVGG